MQRFIHRLVKMHLTADGAIGSFHYSSNLSMYTFILVCSLSNLLLNEYDDDDDELLQYFDTFPITLQITLEIFGRPTLCNLTVLRICFVDIVRSWVK